MAAADTSDAPGLIKQTTQQAQNSKEVPLRARLKGGTAQALMSAAAAVIAYLPTKPLGLHEGFWGSITAIAVVQAQLSATQSSARDQFAGAAIGGLISALIVTVAGQDLPAYVVSLVLSMIACWLLNVSTAARLAGSTVTIIMLVPHIGTGGWKMMLSRLAEVGWGVAVAITIVWVVTWTEGRISKARSPQSGETQS
ncbi:MAG: FUSC family protein [Steroidobacteraceae bacterium]|jgi:uncharacterized membrane protein YgaE (UPF0421/DUF939 family)